MMGERAKEKEEEEEAVSLTHFIHEHPLTLIESDKGGRCQMCNRFFRGEAVYGCKECQNLRILHEDCAEMPREIRHPRHPEHTLLQKKATGSQRCSVCEEELDSGDKFGYFCSSGGCEFQLHMVCTPSAGLENVSDDKIVGIKHPSHPQHQLFMSRKRHTFECDACGAMETGRSYACGPCQYLIHERCAALPTTSYYHHHQNHPLSLAFDLPPDYYKFHYTCDICGKYLRLNRWMYQCIICRYFVHINCAIKPPPLLTAAYTSDNAKGVFQFPTSDFQELIKSFVVREKGELSMPDDDHKYTFSAHPHQLSLVSSPISETDDDDDDERGQVSELVCDGCTLPIFQKNRLQEPPPPPSSSSSSSSDCNKYCNYYMSCGACRYFLHLACFELPPNLSSHPLHKPHHSLVLQACFKLSFKRCSMCDCLMNGLMYSCTKCNFKADIKCVSLPSTIKHEAHAQHNLHSKFLESYECIVGLSQGICRGCDQSINWGIHYKCGSCDFTICGDCVPLPAVNEHESDRHPLPLRYDARLNHPDDFYCETCETQMNPKNWMYHCSRCDTSFHPDCFPTTSGEFRNFKFGHQYSVAAALHPHPLTFGLLTTKLRCDVCGLRVYGEGDVDQRGFHCSSCNFFMCWHRCGEWRRHALSPID